MRLICGLLQLNGMAASEELLRAMAAQMDVPRLHPRLTTWHEGPAALAVLDFAATPTAALQDGARILAADVRLDERAALAPLVGRDIDEGDDAVLMAALERFGPSALDRVLGDFAFAWWDKRAERLVCGRDAFGIRPLVYVHRQGDVFAFASLPRALHGAGLVSKEVDEDAVARRLARNLRHDDSLLASIKRLPPAHLLEVSRDGIQLTRYWQLDRAKAGTRQCSPEQAASEMRRLVAEAVRCRLPPKGTIGVQLSGGLDSSAVAVLAARQLREQGRRLHGYSLLDRARQDIDLPDESEFIAAVLQQETNIDWTPIPRTVGSSSDGNAIDVDTMRPLFERPGSFYTVAESHGITVMLSGWGGDEGATFHGRGTLAELFLRGRWRHLSHEISAISSKQGRPKWRVLRSELLPYIVDRFPLVQRLIDVVRGKQPNDLGQLFHRSLAPAARRRLAASGDAPLSLVADGRENRWRLLTSPHIAERVENNAQIGARRGFAFAFPLLDRRVVEFSMSLPSEHFVRGGIRRRPFRDAMADVLPPKVRNENRKLAPFPSITIDNVARRDEFLAELSEYEQNEIIRRTIDLEWVRRQIEAFPTPDEVREDLRAGRQPEFGPKIAAALRGLTAGMRVERLLVASSRAKMHRAGDAAPLEHSVCRHRLGQAHRLERHVACGARHRPADVGRHLRLLRRGRHCKALCFAGWHEPAKSRRQLRERDEDQR